MSVKAGDALSTGHVSLSDGTVTLELMLCDSQGRPTRLAMPEQGYPRTAMRTAQGAGGYSDFELPYTPIVQVDWSGGRGNDEFEKDARRYSDGYQVDTSRSGLILPAGKATLMSGYKNSIARSGDTDLLIAYPYSSYASSVVPASNFALRSITVRVKTGANQARVSVQLKSGAPGSNLAYGISETLPASETFTDVKISIAYNMVAGTTYYIEFIANSGVTFKKGSLSGTTLRGYNTNLAGWETVSNDTTLAYTLEDCGLGTAIFFRYKGLTYAINRGDDGTAPRMFVNGVTGLAMSNQTALNKLKVEYYGDLTAYGLVGKIVRIIQGPGYGEYRTIKAVNNVGPDLYEIEVDPPWRRAHTSATVYVIDGLDLWFERTIGTFAPTKPISDVCVVDDRVYICQGDEANVVRMTSTLTTYMSYTGGDEGYKADFMELLVDTDGKKRIFRAVAMSSMVYKAEAGATPLSWTQVHNGKAVGSSDTVITGLGVYDDPQRPWVFKEDEFGSISNDIYAPVPLGELRAVSSPNNGRAWVQSNRFLFFSTGESIQRYYQSALDDVGPDRDEGLPSDRRGVVADMVAYPGGTIFAAIDAGEKGYSQVLRYNGDGWCELYRAPLGRRIRRLHVQNIPGLQYQRLLISVEEDIYWIPIAKNPLKANGFKFNRDSEITFSWMLGNYKDINKFWNSVKLFVENAGGGKYVRAWFRTDQSPWYQLTGDFNESPRKEISLHDHSTPERWNATAGVKFQLKLQLVTDDEEIPVYIKTAVVESVTRVPTKSAWPITFVIADLPIDAQGDVVDTTATATRAQLKAWADSRIEAKPLLMRTENPMFDGIYVFVDQASIQPIEYVSIPEQPRKLRAICRMTLIEA